MNIYSALYIEGRFYYASPFTTGDMYHEGPLTTGSIFHWGTLTTRVCLTSGPFTAGVLYHRDSIYHMIPFNSVWSIYLGGQFIPGFLLPRGSVYLWSPFSPSRGRLTASTEADVGRRRRSDVGVDSDVCLPGEQSADTGSDIVWRRVAAAGEDLGGERWIYRNLDR